VPLTETDAQRPINPYGYTKLVVEQMLRDAESAHGIRHVALRYFNAAGADPDGELGELHEPETHLIPLVLFTAMGQRPSIQVFGAGYATPDGTCVRDYVHVSDLAGAHVAALEWIAADKSSNSFNLGNDRGFSVAEVIRTAEEVTGSAIKAQMRPRRPGDPPTWSATQPRRGSCSTGSRSFPHSRSRSIMPSDGFVTKCNNWLRSGRHHSVKTELVAGTVERPGTPGTSLRQLGLPSRHSAAGTVVAFFQNPLQGLRTLWTAQRWMRTTGKRCIPIEIRTH